MFCSSNSPTSVAIRKYPAIICVHPGGGVKEQTAGLYTEKFSK